MLKTTHSNHTIGFFSGILSIIITTTFLIVAFFVSSDYNFYLKTISKLGVDQTARIPFFIGVFLGGTLLFVFHYYYFEDLQKVNLNVKYGRIFGMIAGLGMIGVSLLPDYEDIFFSSTHFIAALIFFTAITFSILFYGLYLHEIKSAISMDKILFLLSLIVLIMSISHAGVSFFKQSLFIGDFEFSLSVVMQKITVFAIFSWFLLMLISKNSLNLKLTSK